MRLNAKLLTALLITVLALLILGACGGDDSDDTATPTPAFTPAAGVGGPTGPGVTDTEIRLGMTNDLSGSGKTPYAVITSAIQAYLKKWNQEDGGVCARQLVLLAEDDQYSPEGAAERTRKLVEQDQVLAMIGGLGTQVHAAVAPYLQDPNADTNLADGVPDLFVSTGWSAWGDIARFPWTVGFIPDYVSDARVLTRVINDDFGGKKVAIMYQGDDFGNDYLRGLRETIDDGERLVSEQLYDPAASDLREQLLAVRDAGAEVVLLALTPDATAEVYKAAEAESFQPRWLFSYVNSPSALARDIGGGTLADQLLKGFEQLDGSISTAYLLSAVDDAESPPVLEHKRIMETYGGPVVSNLSVYGQALAETVIETLNRSCNNLTREGVLASAESIFEFRPSLMLNGINIKLGAEDHYAIQTLQVVEIQKDGTLTKKGDPISVE